MKCIKWNCDKEKNVNTKRQKSNENICKHIHEHSISDMSTPTHGLFEWSLAMAWILHNFSDNCLC